MGVMPVRLALVLGLLVLGGVATAAPAAVPKADHTVINLVNGRDRWQAVHDEVRPVILALGEARTDEDRKPLEDRLVDELGRKAIEVLVRYREPFLVPVFARLTEHEDWAVRRLAVFALQRNLGLQALDRIVVRLADDEALVREIAATTVAILHVAASKHKDLLPRDKAIKAAAKGMRKRKKADLAALQERLAAEKNPFVQSALRASIESLGKRKLLLIHTEPVVEEAPGRFVPRLEGGQVNAYQTGSGISSSGSGRLKPTTGWGYPVMLYPREVLTLTSDPPLVPLPQKGNSFHYGHDCGWFLEGSGIYAVADGVVRWIRSGGDWGGLLVTEHQDADGAKVSAVNGHCGMWMFVKGGEKVVKGQLLAQMGLSFSAENGGHGAHDHFGLYTGGFSEGHCYGRGRTDRTNEEWLVPADFLTEKVEGERLAPDSYR